MTDEELESLNDGSVAAAALIAECKRRSDVAVSLYRDRCHALANLRGPGQGVSWDDSALWEAEPWIPARLGWTREDGAWKMPRRE